MVNPAPAPLHCACWLTRHDPRPQCFVSGDMPPGKKKVSLYVDAAVLHEAIPGSVVANAASSAGRDDPAEVQFHLEHFHADCYDAAGEPHGDVDTTPVVKARRTPAAAAPALEPRSA